MSCSVNFLVRLSARPLVRSFLDIAFRVTPHPLKSSCRQASSVPLYTYINKYIYIYIIYMAPPFDEIYIDYDGK